MVKLRVCGQRRVPVLLTLRLPADQPTYGTSIACDKEDGSDTQPHNKAYPQAGSSPSKIKAQR